MPLPLSRSIPSSRSHLGTLNQMVTGCLKQANTRLLHVTKQPTSEPASAPASFQKVVKPSFERPQSRSHMSVISSGYPLAVAQTKTKREHHLFCGFQVDTACGVCVCVYQRGPCSLMSLSLLTAPLQTHARTGSAI